MRQFSILISLIILLFFLHGCGYREGVLEPDRQSYLWFSGDTSGAQVIIDENITFTLNETDNPVDKTGTQKTGKGRILYSVKPGKHEIIIKKDGNIIVHRVLLIDEGITKEVHVP